MAQEDEEGEEGIKNQSLYKLCIKYKKLYFTVFLVFHQTIGCPSNTCRYTLYYVSSSINKQDKKEVITSEKTKKRLFYFYSPLYFWLKA